MVLTKSFYQRVSVTRNAFAGTIFGAVFALTNIAFAQPIEKEIKTSPVVQSVAVPAGYASRDVTVYFVVTGNVSQNVDLYFGGPANATVTVKAKPLSKSGIASALNSSSGWVTLGLNDGKSKKDKTSVRLAGTPAALLTPSIDTSNALYTPSAVTDICSIITPADYEKLRQFMIEFAGVTYTDAEICELYRGTNGKDGGWQSTIGTPTGSGPGSTIDDNSFNSQSSGGGAFRAVLHKDACGMTSKSKYLVRIDMNLAKVDASAIAQGFEANFGAYPHQYSGSRRASLKPTSEGRYAPAPLLLMSSIGYGTHKLNLVQWKDGKIRSSKSLTKHDFIYWYGGTYARFPLSSKVMSGKKETVEVLSGGQLYSVCFQMTRKRQKLFGYK